MKLMLLMVALLVGCSGEVHISSSPTKEDAKVEQAKRYAEAVLYVKNSRGHCFGYVHSSFTDSVQFFEVDCEKVKDELK